MSGCLFGLVNGARHALEPDHLAAVSSLVAGERSARTTMRFGAFWGMGHALMLVAAGGALYLLERRLPDRVANAFELVVAAMLVALGARGIVRALRGAAPSATHDRPSRLPFAVGLVHGLAGSGALTALVLSKMPSSTSGLLFIALYAAGSIAGMAVLAGALGVPLARLALGRRAVSWMVGISGAVSLAFGVVWAWPIVVNF